MLPGPRVKCCSYAASCSAASRLLDQRSPLPGPLSRMVLAPDSWLLLLLCWMQQLLQIIRAVVTENGQVVAGNWQSWWCCCASTCRQQGTGGEWTDTQMVPWPLTATAAAHTPRVHKVFLALPVTAVGCL